MVKWYFTDLLQLCSRFESKLLFFNNSFLPSCQILVSFRRALDNHSDAVLVNKLVTCAELLFENLEFVITFTIAQQYYEMIVTRVEVILACPGKWLSKRPGRPLMWIGKLYVLELFFRMAFFQLVFQMEKAAFVFM